MYSLAPPLHSAVHMPLASRLQPLRRPATRARPGMPVNAACFRLLLLDIMEL